MLCTWWHTKLRMYKCIQHAACHRMAFGIVYAASYTLYDRKIWCNLWEKTTDTKPFYILGLDCRWKCAEVKLRCGRACNVHVRVSVYERAAACPAMLGALHIFYSKITICSVDMGMMGAPGVYAGAKSAPTALHVLQMQFEHCWLAFTRCGKWLMPSEQQTPRSNPKSNGKKWNKFSDFCSFFPRWIVWLLLLSRFLSCSTRKHLFAVPSDSMVCRRLRRAATRTTSQLNAGGCLNHRIVSYVAWRIFGLWYTIHQRKKRGECGVKTWHHL